MFRRRKPQKQAAIEEITRDADERLSAAKRQAALTKKQKPLVDEIAETSRQLEQHNGFAATIAHLIANSK